MTVRAAPGGPAWDTLADRVGELLDALHTQPIALVIAGVQGVRLDEDDVVRLQAALQAVRPEYVPPPGPPVAEFLTTDEALDRGIGDFGWGMGLIGE